MGQRFIWRLVIPRRRSSILKLGLFTAVTVGVFLAFLTLGNQSYLKRVASIWHDKVATNSDLSSRKIARMSFDPNLFVHCKESPYVLCETPPVVQLNKTFKIAPINYKSMFHERAFSLKRCSYKNCIYQGDNISSDTDIVAVYSVGIDRTTPLPKRWPNQTYIFMGWESPYLFFGFLEDKTSQWNHIFNLTMTYRVDSDIFAPYHRLWFIPQPLETRPNYMEIAKGKNKTVVWLISHCLAESKREEYIKTMRKYVDIDIIGRCGKECPSDCFKSLAKTYKFYIAFENSLCTDYITEKFYKNFIWGQHIIPVVRGGGNYRKYFPENTFIDAANFQSAKGLALHLRKLGSDVETYSKYLEYKDLYVQRDNYLIEVGCILCEYLNTKKLKPKKYDTYDWFVEGHCNKDPKDMW